MMMIGRHRQNEIGTSHVSKMLGEENFENTSSSLATRKRHRTDDMCCKGFLEAAPLDAILNRMAKSNEFPFLCNIGEKVPLDMYS
ncbi:hypothetical protein L1987_54356 [Smallanthus sonchifolius]|uniref:Uncharacterized protein n=1 Tax=Smallanthus sonchifolius TaxID=185202 RepID=A0ACB9E791_9ASTR|nr:hypothetical protein L1987_54356 [Smallanthus sonchifolius]